MTVGPPAALSPAQARLIGTALRAQGYLLLPRVFEPALIAAVRAELDAARLREERRFGVGALADIGQLGYVCDVPGMGPATRALLDHDVIDAVVRTTLGGNARLSVAQGISLDPGMGRGNWPRRWHADLFQIREALPDPGFCFGVNCLVVLEDMTEANGATSVLPGSQAHVRPRSADGAEIEAIAVTATAPAGSLLVLDGGLWHAAGHNSTDKPRRVLKLLFVRNWIRPQLDYAKAVPPGVAERLSPRVAELLGLGPGRTEAEPR
jgi:hypothetical protein